MDELEPKHESALTEQEEAEVARLLRLYRRESERCARAGANLAACVMAGAALEAALLLAVHAFPDEAHSAMASLEPNDRPPKSLHRWTLAQLVNIARGADWIPAGLKLDDEWDHRRAHVGDRAVALKQLRNCLHPANYAAHHRGKRVTAKYARFAIDTLNEVINSVLARVALRLRAAEDERDRARGATSVRPASA